MAESVAAVRAYDALLGGVRGMVERTTDAGRLARIASLAGCGRNAILPVVEQAQQSDGGWVDVDDSIWCTVLLTQCGSRAQPLETALGWLAMHRAMGGGWGRSERDQARIPPTAIVLRFLGDLIGEPNDWLCLDAQWASDLDASVQLSYKGGFYLCCQSPDATSSALVRRTVDYIESQPNSDGGFGPWREHPIGSDPWSTGVCLAGLSRFPELVDRHVMSRAVQWLIDTQLESGYWPYHFIDEGTAYAYWGLSEAAKLLEV